jgi:hypothetical protein
MFDIRKNDDATQHKYHKFCLEHDGQCYGGFETENDAQVAIAVVERVLRRRYVHTMMELFGQRYPQ